MNNINEDELMRAAMGDLDDLGNSPSQNPINPPQPQAKTPPQSPFVTPKPISTKSSGFNKKIVAFVTVITLVVVGAVVAVVANSNKTTEEYADANHFEIENNEQLSENNGFSNGIKIEIDDTEYSFPMLVSDFHNLGWEYPYSEDFKLPAYDSDKEYLEYQEKYKNSELGVIDIDVYVFNYSSESKYYSDCAVAGFKISERDFPTGNVSFYGLTIGRSTYNDVIETFENIVEDDGCYYYYFLEHDNKKHMIEFYFDDSNILSGLKIVNADINLFDEGDVKLRTVDDSFNVVPDSISNDLFDYQFMVNGDLYQMPVTPQALLDNNYDIPDAETIISSGKSYELKVNYNGASTTLFINNFSDGPAKAKDCPITSITLGYSDNVFRDFELSGDITMGTDPYYIVEYLISMGMNEDDIDLDRLTNEDAQNRFYQFYSASDGTISGVKINFYGYLTDLY